MSESSPQVKLMTLTFVMLFSAALASQQHATQRVRPSVASAGEVFHVLIEIPRGHTKYIFVRFYRDGPRLEVHHESKGLRDNEEYDQDKHEGILDYVVPTDEKWLAPGAERQRYRVALLEADVPELPKPPPVVDLETAERATVVGPRDIALSIPVFEHRIAALEHSVETVDLVKTNPAVAALFERCIAELGKQKGRPEAVVDFEGVVIAYKQLPAITDEKLVTRVLEDELKGYEQSAEAMSSQLKEIGAETKAPGLFGRVQSLIQKIRDLIR